MMILTRSVTALPRLCDRLTYSKELSLWLPMLRALRVLMKHNMDKGSEHCMAACDLVLNMLKVCCSSEQGPGDSPELAGEIKV